MPATTFAVTVGQGGTARTSGASNGVGGNSIISGTGFSTLTAYGGGGGGNGAGAPSVTLAEVGGSGGGGGGTSVAGGAAYSTSPSQGFAGGTGGNAGGGGGGAYAVGGSATGSPANTAGAGGAGKASSITGSSVTYAGGGGGGATTPNHGVGGAGGGGTGGSTGNGFAGTDGLGGGGGGGYYNTLGADGGDGIVIIRRPTTATSAVDLTLQSTATTAESAPTKADLVVLIEDREGTATLNTDIKGYISRNGSAFSSAVTFVDEGDWGSNKRILVARQVDISGITTGTSMKYKLTTHNQVASSKETYIHATSLAWA
ncbi:uncharacterized protein METZ01_LOCUS319413 [marine metagenome]|uniref:Glycine-rich domain-containing protein n=1 Tax=marine metagenome TaxID=408172 RepID=A0A382NZL1_9ZZZZ